MGFRLIGDDALDLFGFTFHIGKKLANAAFPEPNIGRELLQALDVAVGEGCYALVSAVGDIKHFPVIDVVGISSPSVC